jgi:hypothetical protein
MPADQKPLRFSEYKTRLAGFRPKEGKFQGFIGCSMTGLATDPTYHELLCPRLSETPADAMRAAADLFFDMEMADRHAHE